MPFAALYQFPLPPPLPEFAFNSTSKQPQHEHQQPLQLLLEWDDFDLATKAGPLQGGHFPEALDPVGVMEAVAAASDLTMAVTALKGVQQLCIQIRSRFDGEISNSKLHVLGILHNIFASGDGAKVPRPCAARGKVDGYSPWTGGKITAELLEDLVCVLLGLACELASASKSLPRDRSTDALDVVVMGVLVAVMGKHVTYSWLLCANSTCVVVDAALMQDVTDFGDDASPAEHKTRVPRSLPFQKAYARLALQSCAASGLRFADVTATSPMVWPGACTVRADVQAYFDSAEGRSQNKFMDWKLEHDMEKQCCFRIPDSFKPLDPSVDIFRSVAKQLGYNVATNIKQFEDDKDGHGTEGWKMVFAKRNYGNVDVGQQQWDQMMAKSAVKLIKRVSADCAETHQEVYYKRSSDVSSVSTYELMLNTWSSQNNKPHIDFELYSSGIDALEGTNSWLFANYDDGGIGFPRHSGPTDGVGGQWKSRNKGGVGNYAYYIFVGEQSLLRNYTLRRAVTTNGHAVPPLGAGGADFPDEIIRRKAIYNELKSAGEDFEAHGIPDKMCHLIAEHELAVGWALGTHLDNKVLAQVKSLVGCRDLLLLYKIMLEPPNYNTKPIIPIEEANICAWDPIHARPFLVGTKSDFDSSAKYHGRLIGISAFNRAWLVGLSCSLRVRSWTPSNRQRNQVGRRRQGAGRQERG
jgi:hypothetical protein